MRRGKGGPLSVKSLCIMSNHEYYISKCEYLSMMIMKRIQMPLEKG